MTETETLPEGEAAASEPGPGAASHHPDTPDGLIEFMARDWAAPPAVDVTRHPAAEDFARRRSALSERFAGRALVIPTGSLKIRANDTDYRFRPGTDFVWLCGHHEPDGVLVLEPTGDRGHTARLYVEPRADRSSPAFFTDPRFGELWVGPRRGVEESAEHLGIECAPLGQLEEDLARFDAATIVGIRDLDPAIDALLPGEAPAEELTTALSELRLVKDDFEVDQLQAAVNSTIRGFEDVVRAIPDVLEHGERYVEGVFNLRARVEGNDTGYNTIAASGSHATVLHWTRNDGAVRNGELLLLDAGVECNELYTADVTRTLPINGRFSPEQRRLYDLVLHAQREGIEAVRPGAAFLAPHRAATRVLIDGLIELGILDADARAAIEEQQLHRRYTLHGTSHMLGLDVHDCAHARDEMYRYGTLEPGYVITVEPGLYFQPDDLTVPEKLRGIGIRIEDDVLVTATGHRVLSAALPTDPDEIERWMARIAGR